MGRRHVWRRVSYIPSVNYFKPAGIQLRYLEEVSLTVEEIEAIRLKDIEDLEQEQCAEKMNVSRTTYIRILDSARKKIADALTKGKAILIEGGNYEMAVRRFRCINNHEWNVPFETLIKAPPEMCPTCSDADIVALPPSIHDNLKEKAPPEERGLYGHFRHGREPDSMKSVK